ncbi:phosphate ABC transporter substrate-binding protein [bacterium]|nr:phosphate ABC transporter substrate-binding protein [bacterium]
MQRLITRMAAILAVALMAVACGGAGEDGQGQEEVQSVIIKGSDTIVNLSSAWAEQFMNTHPNIDISVTGGGSGTGIAALINGTTDICNASRAMKPKEKEQAAAQGVTPVEWIVAMDGIAVVVNPENPVGEMTMDQIGAIYTGEISNWSAVGGPDQEIVVLSRESNSGTYVFFQEHVMAKKDYRKDARLMTSNAAITQSVQSDQWTIGYVGVAYAEHAEVKIVAVKKDADSDAVIPTIPTVMSGEYPIARPLYLYTNGQPTGATKQFIDFCQSTEGQKIVTEIGYVPVPPGGMPE